MTRWILAALVLYWASSHGEAAWACSTCFSQTSGDQRIAYYGTTLVLSALPPLLFGGLLLWLRWASRRRGAPPSD